MQWSNLATCDRGRKRVGPRTLSQTARLLATTSQAHAAGLVEQALTRLHHGVTVMVTVHNARQLAGTVNVRNSPVQHHRDTVEWREAHLTKTKLKPVTRSSTLIARLPPCAPQRWSQSDTSVSWHDWHNDA